MKKYWYVAVLSLIAFTMTASAATTAANGPADRVKLTQTNDVQRRSANCNLPSGS